MVGPVITEGWFEHGKPTEYPLHNPCPICQEKFLVGNVIIISKTLVDGKPRIAHLKCEGCNLNNKLIYLIYNPKYIMPSSLNSSSHF